MKSIIYLLTILTLVNCQTKQKINNSIDLNKIAIIPFNEKINCYRQEKAALIDDNEIQLINGLVIKAIHLNNESEENIDINDFKFQYMPVINIEDEKIIWINAFVNSNVNDWHKELVVIRGDTHHTFFTFKVNLTTKSVSKLIFEL